MRWPMTDGIFGILLIVIAIWISTHEPDIWRYFEEKARVEKVERDSFMRSCLSTKHKHYECYAKWKEITK